MIPSSKLRLFNDIPLSSESLQTILFESKEQQMNYFFAQKTSVFVGDDFSFIREDQTVKCQADYSVVKNSNYMVFQNTEFYDKWFFAFVTEVSYVNETTCKVAFQVDEWQTYLFDFELKKCFVEREHVSNDDLGIHTVPEGLETGEMEVTNTVQDLDGVGAVAWINSGGVDPFTDPVINNVFSPLRGTARQSTNLGSLTDELSLYSDQAEKVVLVQTIPDNMVIDGVPVEMEREKEISIQMDFGGYTPKNNKLYTYPYTYLVVDNFNGSNNILQWENFRHMEQASFIIYGAPYPKPSMMIFPKYYKNQFSDTSEGVYYDNFPVCGWQSNAFETWVANGGMTKIAVDTGGAILTSGGNLTQGLLSSVVGSLTEIQSRKKHGSTFEGSIGTGSINMAMNYLGFRIRQYSIKREYAQIIDEYFSRFGYKVNRHKVPNLRTNDNVNFVKTMGAIVGGQIPQVVKNKMQSDLDRGMTFWKNPNTIGTI
jgi:hypothetical protein